MATLTSQLKIQFEENEKLEAQIKRIWRGWVMSVDNPMTSYCLGDIVSLSQGLPINVKTKHLLVDEGLPLYYE